MKVTVTERGLEVKRQLFSEPSSPRYYHTQGASRTHQKKSRKLHLGSLLQAVVMQNPPCRIEVKTPRFFPPRESTSSPTSKFASSSGTPWGNSSPLNFQKVFKEKCSHRKVPLSVLISKELRMEKLHEKQQYMHQQRLEMDSRMQQRIHQVNIKKQEQLLEFQNKMETENELLQKSLSQKMDKTRYKARIQRLHSRRQTEWKPSQRLAELSAPIRGIITPPYSKLRKMSSLMMSLKEDREKLYSF